MLAKSNMQSHSSVTKAQVNTCQADVDAKTKANPLAAKMADLLILKDAASAVDDVQKQKNPASYAAKSAAHKIDEIEKSVAKLNAQKPFNGIVIDTKPLQDHIDKNNIEKDKSPAMVLGLLNEVNQKLEKVQEIERKMINEPTAAAYKNELDAAKEDLKHNMRRLGDMMQTTQFSLANETISNRALEKVWQQAIALDALIFNQTKMWNKLTNRGPLSRSETEEGTYKDLIPKTLASVSKASEKGFYVSGNDQGVCMGSRIDPHTRRRGPKKALKDNHGNILMPTRQEIEEAAAQLRAAGWDGKADIKIQGKEWKATFSDPNDYDKFIDLLKAKQEKRLGLESAAATQKKNDESSTLHTGKPSWQNQTAEVDKSRQVKLGAGPSSGASTPTSGASSVAPTSTTPKP
jgi:hypothetical protein